MAKSSTSPTQRTLMECKRNGWSACVSEKWVAIRNHPAGGVRRDLFGFIDVVALTGTEIIGIQATSTGWSARVKKIVNECGTDAAEWLKSGGRIQVWGWRKLKKKQGNRSWFPKVVEITVETLTTHQTQNGD